MRISSMANVAFERRRDVGDPDGAPRTLAEIAEAKGEDPNAQGGINTAIDALMTYIPTEILTLYVALVALIYPEGNAATPGIVSQTTAAEQASFWIFLALTPTVVWLVYAGKCRSANKPLPTRLAQWPKWEMFAASVAFLGWAFVLPNNPVSGEGWYSPDVAAFIVLVVSAALGLLAPIFNRPLAP